MRKFIGVLFGEINRNKNLVVFSVAVFILGVILGVTLTISEQLECLYNNYLTNYLLKVFSREFSPIKLFFERLLNCGLILFLVALFSLNKYTIYLNFLILLYKAFMLGLAGKLFIVGALLSGFFTFVFLILFQSIFLCFAIVLLLVLSYGKHGCNLKNTVLLVGKSFLICYLVAGIGVLIEFIFIVFMFRPLSIIF